MKIEGDKGLNDKFFDLKREKQDRIINACLKVFAENGYRHASTDNMVKEAGISKGLLFHYFNSKIGLYSFLFDYSVKYMLFEFTRVIGPKEKDYFIMRKKMESAKLHVLRNYPYMNEFIEKGLVENQIDAIEAVEESKNSYMEQIFEYARQVKTPKLKHGLTEERLNRMITFMVQGLTREQMNAGSYQPEMLYEQINDYLEIIKKMAIE